MTNTNPINEMMCSAKKAGKKTVKAYEFIKGLSVKNKACFDIQLKSDKSFVPLTHHCFSYNKEFKIMPIIYVMGAIVGLCTVCKIMKKDK